MDDDNGFLARVDKDLADLVDKDQELAAKEETTRQARAELRAQITKLRRLRAEYQAYMGIAPSSTAPEGMLVPGELVYEPKATVADLAIRTIGQHGGKSYVTVMLAELARLGKLSVSPAGYATLYRALSRDPRVQRVAPGEFRLVAPPDGAADAEPDGVPGSRS